MRRLIRAVRAALGRWLDRLVAAPAGPPASPWWEDAGWWEAVEAVADMPVEGERWDVVGAYAESGYLDLSQAARWAATALMSAELIVTEEARRMGAEGGDVL